MLSPFQCRLQTYTQTAITFGLSDLSLCIVKEEEGICQHYSSCANRAEWNMKQTLSDHFHMCSCVLGSNPCMTIEAVEIIEMRQTSRPTESIVIGLYTYRESATIAVHLSWFT